VFDMALTDFKHASSQLLTYKLLDLYRIRAGFFLDLLLLPNAAQAECRLPCHSLVLDDSAVPTNCFAHSVELLRKPHSARSLPDQRC
jgi:hypothetical protein